MSQLRLPLYLVACAWLLCSGIASGTCSGRSVYCAWSGNKSASAGGPPTPVWFDQTSDSAGIWLISTGTADAITISLTNMTADFDLYIRLPAPPAPSACFCGSEDPIYYRISDSGGLPGTADECEYLTLSDLSMQTCILAVAYCKSPGGGSFDFDITCHVGAGPGPGTCGGPPPPPAPTCTLTGPGGIASGDIALDLDSTSVSSATIDAIFDFSTDGGATYTLCTTAATSAISNPASGISTGLNTYLWDSSADDVGLLAPVSGVRLRATIDDGVSPALGQCVSTLTVDNSAPPPVCMLNAPGAGSRDIPLDLDAMSSSSPTVDATFEFSTDSGVTFATCSAAPTSLIPNPAVAIPTGIQTFLWDTLADGLGAPGHQSVLPRAIVTDGVSPTPSTCTSAYIQINNAQLCPTFCGDCDSNGLGPTILDALASAQLAAGLLLPTPAQQACCDVDSNGLLAILDALKIAQAAAALPTTLTCP